MAGGIVDRTLLDENFQSAGEVYDDTKTEGAINVLADQIDANWNAGLGNYSVPAANPFDFLGGYRFKADASTGEFTISVI